MTKKNLFLQMDTGLGLIGPAQNFLQKADLDTMISASGLTTTFIWKDLDRIKRARGRLETTYVRDFLKDEGLDPDKFARLPFGKRRKLHNRMVRDLSALASDTADVNRLANVILEGKSSDRVVWYLSSQSDEHIVTTVGKIIEVMETVLRERYKNHAEMKDLDLVARVRVFREVGARLAKIVGTAPSPEVLRAAQEARNALHKSLRTWALGPLVMERPQGSSLHHMIDYDPAQTEGLAGRSILQSSDMQSFVVENDWGKAVPPVSGYWRVPYGEICWEFRISGVRCLALTVADREPGVMFLVYGRDGHWVGDDYQYELGCPELPRGELLDTRRPDPVEFRRVAKMCYDAIRAACIMLDAHVAHNEKVAASPSLVERRAREGRAPLRDHYVVRLIRQQGRHVHHRARSAGYDTEGRAPQRGHWRAGTYVHFDDQDSGQEQYVNDGGFIVSKTWRRWHFAGDPNNIIQKEYRV